MSILVPLSGILTGHSAERSGSRKGLVVPDRLSPLLANFNLDSPAST
jgi:hypothetical protein